MQKFLRIQTQNPSSGTTLLYEDYLDTDGQRYCFRECSSGALLCIERHEDGLTVERQAKDIRTSLTLRESECRGEIRGDEGTFELTGIRFLEYCAAEGKILLRYFLNEEFLIKIEELGVRNVDEKSINGSGI